MNIDILKYIDCFFYLLFILNLPFVEEKIDGGSLYRFECDLESS